MGILTGLVGASVVPRAVGSRAGTPAPEPGEEIARRLSQTLRSRRSARVVGREFLALHPSEADRDFLVESLAPSAPRDGKSMRTLDREELVPALKAKIQDDFANARTVRIRGWILSLTEARLCALATLV